MESQLRSLQEIIKKFCEEREWDQFHSPKDLAIGLVTESSELLELFRFKSPEEILSLFDHPKKGEDIRDELADIFYFLLRFAQRYNIDLEKELLRKLEKNASRYPVDKARGSNKKYNEF